MGAPLKSKSLRDTRISLSVPKEVADGVKLLAQLQNKSTNDFITSILQNILQANAPLIAQYEESKLNLLSNLQQTSTLNLFRNNG